jgi:hypothetical protein
MHSDDTAYILYKDTDAPPDCERLVIGWNIELDVDSAVDIIITSELEEMEDE